MGTAAESRPYRFTFFAVPQIHAHDPSQTRPPSHDSLRRSRIKEVRFFGLDLEGDAVADLRVRNALFRAADNGVRASLQIEVRLRAHRLDDVHDGLAAILHRPV